MSTSTVSANTPSADPTVVFVVKQVSYVIASVAMIAGTVILALQHLIQDGEIVTLLVTAVGAHVLAGAGNTGLNNNTLQNETPPAGTAIVRSVVSTQVADTSNVPAIATVPAATPSATPAPLPIPPEIKIG